MKTILGMPIMWRLAALKEKANNSNDPLVRKLYKKQRYYLV